MTTNKDQAIEVMDHEFERMSNLVLMQLELLDKILVADDDKTIKDIGKTLKENENEIDNLEIILDNKIVQAIVLYKPVASDLRHIFAQYRMMINLERIGDLIIKIFYYSQDMKDKYLDKSSGYLLEMLRAVTKMVKNAILSFTTSNVEDAIKTIKKDVYIDELNQKILKKTLAKMDVPKESQSLIINFVDIRSMVSSIERIGDKATNIAEASIYAMTGTNIAHSDLEDYK